MTCSVTVEFYVGGCQPYTSSSSLTVGDGTTSGAVALQGDNDC